ncbi:Cytochrome c [Planctomycetes bacterium Pla163]|uniref:Cytochrome c n=2 Tax=Rohdeia mirabilis TaxID=2528008 RepID=A0A518CXL5_9BACT|nr:Cytochrome c [Planctomycetes bacterium Pla163]
MTTMPSRACTIELARARGAARARGLGLPAVVLLFALAGPSPAQQDTGATAVPADWQVPDGYAIEIVHTVDARTQGSWVSLATGPSTEDELVFFAGDQYGALHEVRLPRAGGETRTRSVSTDLGHAQGLLWFEDELLVVVNDSWLSGLYALGDADGDGQLEPTRQILALTGEGEHGPHAVVLAPDGEHVLVVCGNHTQPPAELAWSRVPAAAFTEGLLAPREWDPNGHARNVLAPGGYVIEVDPRTGAAGLVACGFRNSYDLAVVPSGEVYTFDSDMEWDMGSPWYRPTRLIEVMSGGDHGWRSGSGKWPVWREDAAAPVADVGPGSPTGVTSGAGAAFPAADQRALYLLDWTFGTVHRARLSDDGAGHTAELEPFLTGRALPLTDAVIAADGAMYLTTGGRRTRSHLLRVRYVGDASVEPVTWPAPDPAAQRRVALERFHLEMADAEGLEQLIGALGDRDRRIRYAARVGLEHQPLESWAPRLSGLVDPFARAVGWLGVLRATSPSATEWIDAALEDLGRFAPGSSDAETLLAWLRAHQWALIERSDVTARWRERLIARLDPLYPSANAPADAELAVLLVHLGAPRVIERTLDLMESAPNTTPSGLAELIARNPAYGDPIAALLENPPPTEGLRFAFALRQVADGWNWESRERWFRWVQTARRSSGGVSFGGFLDQAEAQALATCDAVTRLALQPLLARTATDLPGVAAIAPSGPGVDWTVATAESSLTGRITGADFERGAGLFGFACASCHRIAGAGGSVGPDLTTAADTFTLHDLLVAVLEPDASISDQYRLHEWQFTDGTRRIARHLGQAADGQYEYLENLLDPSRIGRIAPDRLVSVEPSPHSPMPSQLTRAMNPQELRDLVAHVASAGGTRRDLSAWQGVRPVPRPQKPVLSPVALRILFGAVAALVALLAGIGVLMRRGRPGTSTCPPT